MKERKKGKNTQAYEFLNQYERLMYEIARQYVGSQIECEEVVQDSLTNILKKFDIVMALNMNQRTAYVAAVVRNRSLNYLKRKSLEDKTFVASGNDESCCVSSSTLQTAKQRDSYEMSAVREALDNLSYDDRYLIEGKYIMGLTDSEFAEELCCKPAHTRIQLTKACRRLLAELERIGKSHE